MQWTREQQQHNGRTGDSVTVTQMAALLHSAASFHADTRRRRDRQTDTIHTSGSTSACSHVGGQGHWLHGRASV